MSGALLLTLTLYFLYYFRNILFTYGKPAYKKITKKIKALIVGKADSDMIGKQAIDEGMTTMLDDGLNKVKRGLTTLEEVLRVTKIGLS